MLTQHGPVRQPAETCLSSDPKGGEKRGGGVLGRKSAREKESETESQKGRERVREKWIDRAQESQSKGEKRKESVTEGEMGRKSVRVKQC